MDTDNNEQKRRKLKLKLFDKIKGIIYGTALGDAVGLSTEFMTEQQARDLYGKGPIKFGDAKGYEFWRDRHRSRWFPNDFTDDTDQMILLLQCVLSSEGHVIPTHFAYRLNEWSNKGLPELNKIACGIGYTVGSVMSHPEFLTNPHKAAYQVWDSRERNLAANGAVMRTAVLGVPYFWDETKVVENAILAAKVTHSDPRSVISAIIINAVIAKLLQIPKEEKSTKADIEVPEVQLHSDIQKDLMVLFEAGSPFSDYNLLSKEGFKQYDTTLEPKPEAQSPPKSFMKRLTSFLQRENSNDDLSKLKSMLPEYEAPDAARLKNPVNIPDELVLRIDGYETDTELESLCKNAIEKYEFLLSSSSLSPTSLQSPEDGSKNPTWVEQLHSHCFPSKVADLKLSENGKIGYTFKCLGSAIYCLTRAKPADESAGNFFKRLITELTLQAGDADTNCAVAGGLLGCRLGMKGLPKDWLKGLRHSEFLEDISSQLCNLVWLKYNERQDP